MDCRHLKSATQLISLLIVNSAVLVFAGSFQAPTNYIINPYPTGVVLADFNRDGIPDLALPVCGDQNCVSTGSIQVLLGRGDGTFTLGGVFVAGPAHTTADTLATGDFNGDGVADLVVVNNGINLFGSVSVLLGDGTGGFQPPVSYSVGGSTPVWVALGDFNGDRRLDLAVSVTTTNSVAILLGNGDGTFQLAVNYPIESSPQGIAVGDVNSDGKPDVVAANECGEDPACRKGTVSVLLGNGDGTFQPELSFAAGLFPLSVGIADFNGDGHPDLAVAEPCGTDPTCTSIGSVGILLGNGDGTFQPIAYYPSTDFGTTRVTIGDFNGDHHPDVVALNSQVSDFTVLLGNGDGTFRPGITYAVGLGPIWAAVGDVNGDGAADLAVPSEFATEVGVLLNSGGTRVTLTSSPNPSQLHQPVTFTVNVKATLQGYGTPTGTVTWTTGSKTIGAASLAGGTATLTTSKLPVGRHAIEAKYSGDPQYNPNISPSITQTVKR